MAWHGQPGGWPSPAYGLPIDPRYMYAAPHPAYGPPQQWYPGPDPYAQQPLQSPPATQPRSSKYPKLNPALAEDTTLVRFDLKERPSKSIHAQAYQASRHEFALATPTKFMRLIFKAFPWSIDIASESAITCEDVWKALHNGFQLNVVDSEWGFLIEHRGQIEAIEAAVKKRVGGDPKADRHVKRIDVLGDLTVFRGLEKDVEFEKMRALPLAQRCEETWVVKLSS